jgi:2-phospho-L-lactate guanylyltransferase
MNRAAALGRRHALRARPTSPVVIMVADLPAVRPDDIDVVVDTFRDAGGPLYVTDHDGTGTTLLIHGPERCPGIGFGRSSAAMHRRLGYRPAVGSPASLGQDLDTEEHLAALPMLSALAPS